MKKLILVVAAMSVSATAAFASDAIVREKVVSILDAYVPAGFDSRSEAFVVVNGLFGNTCYKLKDVKVEHSSATLHEVSAIAEVRSGLCAGGIAPFHKEAPLGRLVSGKHSIRFLNGDGSYTQKTLFIK